MDEKSARSQYEQRINNLVDSLLPHGAGTITETRLRTALEQVAQIAFTAGQDYALMSLMDRDEAMNAVNQRLIADGRAPISKRRFQAIAREKHDRFGIGYNVTGTNAWLFRPSEIDSLIPGDVGRPRKNAR